MSIPEADRRQKILRFMFGVRRPRTTPDPLGDAVASVRPSIDSEYQRAAERLTDPLQRHLLCAATGLHDRGTDGCCRDCTKPLTADDEVCADAPSTRSAPDPVDRLDHGDGF